jgi:hypothetical protein
MHSMSSSLDLVHALGSGSPVVGAELRPPRAELAAGEGMDAWIDTYHAVRGLARQGRYVFLTDSAVGTAEEDNLRHLLANMGGDVPRESIVPFLTTKHSLEYCLSYAERAHQSGFPALVILGGDQTVGTPRCVDHAWRLRQLIRDRNRSLALGGWANPHGDAERQVAYLSDPNFNAEFFLTQIVSHHRMAAVERFLDVVTRQGVGLPGIFGAFFYRSANLKTLNALSGFLPVPVDEITREFAAGATAEEICARTIRALAAAGARHFYVSNLPLARAQPVLQRILSLASTSNG